MESARGSSNNKSELQGLDQLSSSSHLFKNLAVRNIMKTTNNLRLGLDKINAGEEADEDNLEPAELNVINIIITYDSKHAVCLCGDERLLIG